MKIFGVEILNEGSGVSIDDAVTEMQATFVARFVEPSGAVGDGPGRRTSGSLPRLLPTIANQDRTAELYPSKVRATATCWSTGARRISAALSPIAFGYFMAHKMYYGVYVTMALFFWIACSLVSLLGN